MEYYIPYTWYIIYPIHGILYTLYMVYYISYTWYIIYPIHGILYILYMVYYIPYTWYILSIILKSYGYLMFLLLKKKGIKKI